MILNSNLSSNYQPTFMEKLLGRNYKWWFLVLYSFKQANLKLSGFFILNFGSILDFLITLYLWYLIEPTIERTTYMFFGFIFQRLIWSQYLMAFGGEIFSGKINNKILLPTDIFNFWLFKEIGSSSFRNLLSSFLILLFLPFYFHLLKFPTIDFILFLPLLVAIAFFIDYCFSYIFGSLAFWTEDYRALGFLFSVLVKILSGLILPFNILPNKIAFWLKLNPYSLVTYHPMQIYLGKYDNNITLTLPFQGVGDIQIPQVLLVFLGGLAWCLVLYFLAQIVFKMGLKRNESVGL